MNIFIEWLRSLDLIVDRGVECQSFADHFDDLIKQPHECSDYKTEKKTYVVLECLIN
jgi:hypothetical protein